MDGKLIDVESAREIPARIAIERLLGWTEPARAELKLDPHLDTLERMLDSGNGAQRQWRRHEAGEAMRDIYAAGVRETCASFAETPAGVGACAGGVAG
jgi:gamma-glutamyl:cysteine ligase YbdK (ATP-grasp superfamily)